MTKIKIITSKDKFILEIKGHSNYACKGSDIVCASISTLSIFLGNYFLYTQEGTKADIGNGELYLETYHDEGKDINVFGTAIQLLKDLAKQYPKHVSIEEVYE